MGDGKSGSYVSQKKDLSQTHPHRSFPNGQEGGESLISSGATPENRGRTRFFPDNDTQKNRSYVSMKKESVLRGKIHDITEIIRKNG